MQKAWSGTCLLRWTLIPKAGMCCGPEQSSPHSTTGRPGQGTFLWSVSQNLLLRKLIFIFVLSFYIYFSTLLKDWLKIKIQVVHSVNFHCFYEQKQVISDTVTIVIAVGTLLILREGSRMTDNTSIATLRYSADTNFSPNTAFWWKIQMLFCLHFDLWTFL